MPVPALPTPWEVQIMHSFFYGRLDRYFIEPYLKSVGSQALPPSQVWG